MLRLKKYKYPLIIKKLVLILFLLPLLGVAQFNDFQTWTSLELDYELNKKNQFNLEQSLRTVQNATSWRTIFTEINYNHNINKHLSLGVGYRYSYRNKLDYSINSNRITANLKIKTKISRFTFSYRLRFQSEYPNINKQEKLKRPTTYNRHLTKLKYKLTKKIKIYLSSEIYLLINGPIYFSDKYRLTGGSAYKFNKRNTINLFYRYQKEQFIIPTNTYILGVKYKYNL